MKGKYFFIESGKEIEIQEFDYAYVRNAFLREYDRRANRVYCYTVIVKRTYDSLGNPEYDVRTLDLENIYYDNTRLCILNLMKDDICFKNIKLADLPMPPLQREFMEWKEGRAKPIAVVPAKVDIPPPPKRERVLISPGDVRLAEIAEMGDDKLVPMEVLDWAVNLPIRAHEVGANVQKLSERQLDLANVLQQHSDYVGSLMNNLTKVLEELFPLKPTFTQKLFGKTDIKVTNADLPKVLRALNSAVMYDTNKFEGLETLFKEISTDINAIQEDLVQGLGGCKYQIAKIEDPFEFELMQERLQKMAITTDMTEANIVGVSKSFMIDQNRMRDIQTTTIPLIIMRLQASIGKAVDEDTADIIRNLAYGNKK